MTVRGRGLRLEVWGPLPSPRWVGSHRRTTPSSAPVRGTLKARGVPKIIVVVFAHHEHTDQRYTTGTEEHFMVKGDENCMHVCKSFYQEWRNYIKTEAKGETKRKNLGGFYINTVGTDCSLWL